MTETDKLNACRMELARLRDLLREWAMESIRGSWSTHQVRPQRETADKIDEVLDRTK